MKKKHKIYQTVQPGPKPAPQKSTPNKADRVQVGDTVTRTPITIADKSFGSARPMRGRVIWVHSEGRFHVVEFGEGKRTFRESFAGVGSRV